MFSIHAIKLSTRLASVKKRDQALCLVRFAQNNSGMFDRFSSSRFHETFSKTLRNYVFISSSVGSACAYLLMQRKHLCKEISNSHVVGEKYVHPDYEDVVNHCRDLLQRLKDEVGAPGVVIGVSVDGETKWEEGLGYADIENRVPCTRDTVMRIASISKSITMTAVAKLWEDGKLDFDKPVQHYVPDFPKKTFNGEPVEITCRQLVSHLAGIRHYVNKNNSKEATKSGNDAKSVKQQNNQVKGDANAKTTSEFDFEEYYIKDKYDVKSALQLFKDDALVAKPGSSFNYTTHGWTLISAVVEKASNESFTAHIQKLFKDLGMMHTYLDVNDSLIYHRSRNYIKDKRGMLVNAPYVDNSYKWAGGGFLSTVGDLMKFANAMLYSLQYQLNSSVIPGENKSSHAETQENSDKTSNKELSAVENILSSELCKSTSIVSNQLRGYLLPSTVKTMWYPVIKMKEKDWMYGMGWSVLPNQYNCEYCHMRRFCVAHTGGAVGASSVLLIMPGSCSIRNTVECECTVPPKGIVVTILTNLKSVNLIRIAYEIADLFNGQSSKIVHT